VKSDGDYYNVITLLRRTRKPIAQQQLALHSKRKLL